MEKMETKSGGCRAQGKCTRGKRRKAREYPLKIDAEHAIAHNKVMVIEDLVNEVFQKQILQ
jgi:hypothetical protein